MGFNAAGREITYPDHVGYVVHNTDEVARYFVSIGFAVTWQTLELDQQTEGLLAGAPFKLRVTWTKVGTIVMELLQPLDENSMWAEFLKNKGEGIHHVAFSVRNWDERVSQLESQGSKMVVGATYQGKRWAYFDTGHEGLVIEITENPMVEMV
jgi:4-hydroxyphenylpyruvate dioxygenase-like putative hemolysin